MAAALLLPLLLALAPEATLYVGGPLYAEAPEVVAELRASGFTTVVAWTLHIGAKGELIYNDVPLVADGRYLGRPGWAEQLAALKAGGSVGRLLVGVGSGGVEDFHRIRTLLGTEGSGPESRLARNFRALRAALPALDGVDLDDEDLRDQATTVAFCRMLGKLGFRITFCPYDQPAFWAGCLAALEREAPGLVTGLHLQCYEGGARNRPEAWVEILKPILGAGAAGFVQPGLWGRHGPDCDRGDDPAAVRERFRAWGRRGLRGGFIWLYDDLRRCAGQGGAAAYGEALLAGLGDTGKP